MADALGADRKTFGRFLLRWYNPWLFAMIFPEEISEQEVRELPERMVDHRKTGMNIHSLASSLTPRYRFPAQLEYQAGASAKMMVVQRLAA
jgi:hypothetical protein